MSLYGALVMVGAGTGALAWNPLTATAGRRAALLAAALIGALGWLAVTPLPPAAWRVPALYAGRVLSGVATGAATVVCPM